MKIINKDITTLKKGILLQQVNCQNAMGSGVAKAIYLKWPIVKEEYHKFSQNKNPNDLLGLIQEIKINDDLLVVQVYVDDIIFGATNETLCQEFAKLMQEEFEMSMMEELNFFFGLQIKL